MTEWGFGNCWCIHIIVPRPAAALGFQIYSVTEEPNGVGSALKNTAPAQQDVRNCMFYKSKSFLDPVTLEPRIYETTNKRWR